VVMLQGGSSAMWTPMDQDLAGPAQWHTPHNRGFYMSEDAKLYGDVDFKQSYSHVVYSHYIHFCHFCHTAKE